jgi:hypothetical protein
LRDASLLECRGLTTAWDLEEDLEYSRVINTGTGDYNGNEGKSTYHAPIIVLREHIQRFAMEHEIYTSKEAPTQLQFREFGRDVYDFARAAGLKSQEAKVEVNLARSKYKIDRGLSTAHGLEDFSLLKSSGAGELVNMDDALQNLEALKRGMRNALGKLDKVQTEIERQREELISKGADPLGSVALKRKRGVETEDGTEIMAETLAALDATAKLARKEAKRQRRMEGVSQKNSEAQKLVQIPAPKSAQNPQANGMSKRQLKRQSERQRAEARKSSATQLSKSQPAQSSNKAKSASFSSHLRLEENTGLETIENQEPATQDTFVSALETMSPIPEQPIPENLADVGNGDKSMQKRKRKRKRNNNRLKENASQPTSRIESLNGHLDSNKNQQEIEALQDDPPALKKLDAEKNREPEILEANGTGKPLIEITSFDTNTAKLGRRSRGRGRKSIAEGILPEEQSKDVHS